MTPRPPSLLAAAGLLLLIGLSGAGVAGSLLAAMTSADPTGAGPLIGGGFLAYGLALAVAGLALLLGRRWGWWLGSAGIVAGLAGLVWLIAISGPDSVFAFGIGLWILSLACLLAPDTRRAVVAPRP